MPASPIYSPINDSEIESGDPITVSLGLRWAFNYLSVIQGSPSARAAGLGVWIDKSPTGAAYPAADMQSGIFTDCMDINSVLQPNGTGGVQWSSSAVKCVLSTHGHEFNSPSVTTTNKATDSNGNPIFKGKMITVSTAPALLFARFSGLVQTGSGYTLALQLRRVRGATETVLGLGWLYQDINNNVPRPAVFSSLITGHVAGDSYHFSCQNLGGEFYGTFELTQY
jgi:hypothetical protein